MSFHVRSANGAGAVVSLLACLVPLLTGKLIKEADAEPARPKLGSNARSPFPGA